MKTWNKAKYALPVCAALVCSSCDKGDDDPCEPIPEPIEDSIQNPIKDTIQNPINDTIQKPIKDSIHYALQNPIEVNKSRETVNELSDEMKQDVIAYFQNIFCPIWNALWPDRPDLQFNPEDFPDIINKADVRVGDEYFEPHE